MIRQNLVFTRIRQSSVLTILAFCLLLSSCLSQRKLQYVRDKNKDVKTFKEAGLQDYRLKPKDELYIQVTSQDDAAAGIFANSRQESASYMGSINPYGASLMSYSIDKEGFLLLPVIGKIQAKDKTVAEVSQLLQQALINVLNQPVVTIKLVNRFVSVLGEVRTPGNYSYSQEKMTIYDALGMAGDITDFGNRKQVILIRNENGTNTRINIDLTKSTVLSSEYYNLKPNDIVYVKQVRQKFWNISQVPISLFLSAVTTALLIYSIIQP
jgi:polysaccharide export outer membrane protein